MSDRLLTHNGMVLPTEAQWEYCCRAGTTTPWALPYEELSGGANVGDMAAREAGLSGACEPWDDDHGLHAPVGSFTPNAFGLYDMHGNVFEWCRDEVGDYAGPVREGDGLHTQIFFAGTQVIRGGSYGFPAIEARCAARGGHGPSVRNTDLGLRAARQLRP